MLELYKVNENFGVRGEYTLVEHCEGCSRALSGCRSARKFLYMQSAPTTSWKNSKGNSSSD